MNLSWIDWAIMALAVIGLRIFSLSTKKYMKGVADFLSANRSAGRYLLTIASYMGETGAISIIAMYEVYFSRGFSPIFWTKMAVPLSMVLLFTGYVYYRFRESRALTMAQFFEMRYNRRFRIFAGFLCWACGVLNFGIFPAITAHFFVYFCGLNEHIMILGVSIPTIAPIMAVDLLLALTFVTMGGQVSVMVTECVQGMASSFIFLIILGFVLVHLKWDDIITTLNTAPVNESMLNPFKTSKVSDFNIWFYMIGLFGGVYGYMSWQGSQGFYSSAKTPHEQKMGAIIGAWRGYPMALMTVFLPVAAFAILKLPQYEEIQRLVGHTLNTIPNDSLRNQMSTPLVYAHFLPIGIKGLLATCMLFFSFTCHDTYMHSWGSIFIQDIVAPIRKKALDPKQHVKWLQRSIIGVAVFAFFFSLFFPLDRPILMYFAITGTIWGGGSGAVIVGGLYWRRATTAGAYAALILGAVMGSVGLFLPVLYKSHIIKIASDNFLKAVSFNMLKIDPASKVFPINDQWLWMIAMLSAIVVFVVVSLLTCKEKFNLEKLLHRGEYADEKSVKETQVLKKRWLQFVGITPEFSKSDKVLAILLLITNSLWWLSFLTITALHFMGKLPDALKEIDPKAMAAAAGAIVALLGLSNAAGRILWGFISDKIGRLQSLALMFLITGVTMFLLPKLVTESSTLKISAILIGACFGGYLGIFPPLCADSFGVKNMAVNYGLLFSAFSVAAIAGPFVGAYISKSTGSYDHAFVIASVVALLGFVLSISLAISERKSAVKTA